MSSPYSQTNERRLSANGRNVYISLSSPTPNTFDPPINKHYLTINTTSEKSSTSMSSPSPNTYDPQKNKHYLSIRETTKERSPLSSANINAPNIEVQSENENKHKQTSMDVKKSNAVTSSNIYNNINTIDTADEEKSPVLNNSDSPSFSVKNNGAIPKNKSAEINVKVPTGMDRYVTILKRKSSPKSFRLEPNPKQSKTDRVSQNRFSLLDTQETESTPKESRTPKPPPLYLREPSTSALVNKLSQLLGKENFYVVSQRKGNVAETKIQTFTENNFRILVQNFDSEKKNYYTYQLKSAKGLVVVIKGIDSSVPIDEIKEALESEGYEVKSVHNIINKNKVPQPMFKVEISFNSSQLKKKGDTHPIYNLRFLLNRRITVEEPLKRKGPPQCLNCQEFGHTKSFCKLPTVCVRCGDIHKSLECPYSKTENSYRKCSNCSQNHTANYRGCPVYRKLKEKLVKRRPEYAQYQDSYFPNLPSNNIPQYENNINNSFPQLSYAHTVSQNKKVKESNAHLLSNIQNKGSVIHTQIPEKGSAIPNQAQKQGFVNPTQVLKKNSVSQKYNTENNAFSFSYARALKEGSAIPHSTIQNNAPLLSYANTLKEGSEIPQVNTQGSIEKLVETMNSFMINMQNMFQQLMQNQSMLMQILLNKK